MSEILESINPILAANPSEFNEFVVLKTIKRNGKVVSYDEEKIKVAITKAFIAVEGNHAAASARIHQQVHDEVSKITKAFRRRLPNGGTIHIEDIQD